MEKVCLIRQPAGIGDIFYCLKIGKELAKCGYNVIWPLSSTITYLQDYLDDIGGISFVDEQSDFLYKEYYNSREMLVAEDHSFMYLPLQFSDGIAKTDDYFANNTMVKMNVKYRWLNMTSNDWCDYFKFKRNKSKEDELFLKLNPSNEKYILTNLNFGTPPHTDTCRLFPDIEKGIKIIKMQIYPDYNLFDWCKIIENAEEVHTVETSLILLMEKLNLPEKLFMYSRHVPSSFHPMEDWINNKWEFCYD